MLQTLANAFRTPEIRRKIGFVAAMLLIYRVGSYVPSPGVDVDALKSFQDQFSGGGANSSNVLGFLNLFSGGSLSRLSLFALGIMPYITASIILQLLTVVSPTLEQLSREGEIGQQKITQYTRYLTVGLAAAQSLGYVMMFKGGSNPVISNTKFGNLLLLATSMTAGTILLMWIGELITQRGVGNGISLLIFASIISGLPGGLQAWWNSAPTFKLMMPFLALGVIVAVVFIQEGQRRIPVQYAKRQIGRKMTQGGSTYLPLRVNMAGVIPIIFAASIMAFPPTVAQLINTPFTQNVANFFSPNGTAYIVGEALFIIMFTYFYTAVTFNPREQADNLKKNGGFIPGVRPGLPTAEYLDRILARLTFPGALYLAAVASLPMVIINQTGSNFYFGGTSVLIAVGVALDTMKQLEAQLQMRNYEGFLN
jgi:preprotein translocase subunit SecY